MSTFIKATKVAGQVLGALERELMLAARVWRDADADFTGAKDDTVSIRVPAYAAGRTRNVRNGGTITVDDLTETKVDVVLATDAYKAVKISDAAMSLDITDFGQQVSGPVVRAVARKVEDVVATAITTATYPASRQIELNTAKPYSTVVAARKLLNDAKVPFGGRSLMVGSTAEAYMLEAEGFVHAEKAGSDSALREAFIGRVAGFDVFSSQAIDPEEAYAFHRTAFATGNRAPVVPDGVSWGASMEFAGLAVRTIKDYDASILSDRFIANSYVGATAVKDPGTIDNKGVFTPAEDPDASGVETHLVRAVKITVPSA